MQHTNYCRQIVVQLSGKNTELLYLEDLDFPDDLEHQIDYLLEKIEGTVKFWLPDFGWAIDDKELKALDASEPLRLPFPKIALEYRVPIDEINDCSSSRRVVLLEEKDSYIAVRTVLWIDLEKSWQPLPVFVIPTLNYFSIDKARKGLIGITFAMVNETVEAKDFHATALTVLMFLNALQCSNVGFEKIAALKQPKPNKGALPFDSYHILTIKNSAPSSVSSGVGGAHRSPREHLRRGHIRRIADGRKIWVNAAVIAAGRDSGVVYKNYALRRAFG